MTATKNRDISKLHKHAIEPAILWRCSSSYIHLVVLRVQPSQQTIIRVVFNMDPVGSRHWYSQNVACCRRALPVQHYDDTVYGCWPCAIVRSTMVTRDYIIRESSKRDPSGCYEQNEGLAVSELLVNSRFEHYETQSRSVAMQVHSCHSLCRQICPEVWYTMVTGNSVMVLRSTA
jgi:hypothetical protein